MNLYIKISEAIIAITKYTFSSEDLFFGGLGIVLLVVSVIGLWRSCSDD